jgi:hypothetical protein
MTDGTVFASLRRAERVRAVASIHGEADRLKRLHADLARRSRLCRKKEASDA